MSEAAFFDYARKRYQIMLDRADSWPAPWTTDPILQRYRFCNVFREDDRTTAWFRESFRSKTTVPSVLLHGTVVFRWFNRIATGEILMQERLLHRWDSARARRALRHMDPLVTGAYMVKTPAGVNKLEGVIQCLESILPDVQQLAARMRQRNTLQAATLMLQDYPYMGPFMSYEVVTDLRHTPLLDRATDINTWANPGPGAARGLGRVLHGDRDQFNRHSPHQAEEMQEGMRYLLTCSRRVKFWPREWPAWEMREVEHTLCEFDKYERARLEEGRPKQIFRGV